MNTHDAGGDDTRIASIKNRGARQILREDAHWIDDAYDLIKAVHNLCDAFEAGRRPIREASKSLILFTTGPFFVNGFSCATAHEAALRDIHCLWLTVSLAIQCSRIARGHLSFETPTGFRFDEGDLTNSASEIISQLAKAPSKQPDLTSAIRIESAKAQHIAKDTTTHDLLQNAEALAIKCCNAVFGLMLFAKLETSLLKRTAIDQHDGRVAPEPSAMNVESVSSETISERNRRWLAEYRKSNSPNKASFALDIADEVTRTTPVALARWKTLVRKGIQLAEHEERSRCETRSVKSVKRQRSPM